jgi:late competence protein required for DNA uptake (superfamily II DNA/RNA helicase)
MYSSTPSRHAAVTTTSLVQVSGSETRASEKAAGEFHHLHVAWVLAADPKGNPRLRMHWLVD